MTMSFAEWLQKELDKRGWSHSESSRRTGIPRSHISRLLNGTRNAGPDPCIAIAKAFNLPREEVFRARGWLLSEPENPFDSQIDPRVEKLAKKVNELPFESREMALNTMESVLDTVYQLTNKLK